MVTPDSGMEQQPVDLLERDLGEVLVGTMHGVASLESHDGGPSAVGERRTCLGRRRWDVTGGLRGNANRAGDNGRSLREQGRDAGVGLVGGPVHLARLGLEVAIVDLGHGERPEQVTAVIAQRDDRALLERTRLASGGEGDRQCPRRSITERRVLDDAFVVAACLETVER